jgi:hypothetical protein
MTADYNVQHQKLRFVVGVDNTSNINCRSLAAIVEI